MAIKFIFIKELVKPSPDSVVVVMVNINQVVNVIIVHQLVKHAKSQHPNVQPVHQQVCNLLILVYHVE